MEKHEVSGIAHDAQAMANDALQYILQSSLSTSKISQQKRLQFYPNPSENFIYFNNSSLQLKQAKLYNLTGCLVSIFNFDGFNSSQEINVSNQPAGIYFLELGHRLVKLIKT